MYTQNEKSSDKVLYSRRDVIGWLLFMVTKYPIFQLNEKKLTFSTDILQSSSEHTQHAQNIAYLLNTRSRVQ